MSTYKALKIDLETNDFSIENNNFVYIEDIEVIRQNLIHILNQNKGEWFLDQDQGVAYLTEDNEGILGKKSTDQNLLDEMIETILEVQGVQQITDFNVTQQGDILNIDFEVLTEFGEINMNLEI